MRARKPRPISRPTPRPRRKTVLQTSVSDGPVFSLAREKIGEKRVLFPQKPPSRRCGRSAKQTKVCFARGGTERQDKRLRFAETRSVSSDSDDVGDGGIGAEEICGVHLWAQDGPMWASAPTQMWKTNAKKVQPCVRLRPDMRYPQFQSTHPLRGATTYNTTVYVDHIISIHAPLAGCDSGLLRHYGAIVPFQSTHPLRGATTFCPAATLTILISIHAPLAGCDLCVPK